MALDDPLVPLSMWHGYALMLAYVSWTEPAESINHVIVVIVGCWRFARPFCFLCNHNPIQLALLDYNHRDSGLQVRPVIIDNIFILRMTEQFIVLSWMF